MGFWSSLGKGLLNVGKGVAKNLPMIAGVAGAPLTAGGSLFAALAPTIGQTIGSTLSGAAGGMADARKDINLLNQRRHEAKLQHNIARALAGIELGKFDASEQQRGRRDLLINALSAERPLFGLSNVPERIRLPGHTSNFKLPADFFSQFSGGPIKVEGVREAGSPQFQDAGFLEKLTGGAGLGLNVLSSLGQRRSGPALQQFAPLPNLGSVRMGQLQANNPMRFIQPTVPPQKHALIGDKGYL